MPSVPLKLVTDQDRLPAALSSEHRELLRRLRALSKISNQLNKLRTERELLAQVIELVLQGFERAGSVEVVILDRDHEMSLLYSQDRGGPLSLLECGGIDALPQDRREQFAVPQLIPGDGIPGRGAMLSVPLLASGALLGLLVVEGVAGNSFSQADLDALSGVAAQVAMTIQNLRITRRMEEQRRIARDLQAAKRIQRSFLPNLAPTMNGFRVAAEYRPAFDVGGDFYDVVASAPGKLTAVVGDVSGKGVSGALVMARVTTEIRRLASSLKSTHRLLETLNESFAVQACDETFVTAVAVELDARKRRVTVANAGHVVPLLRRASGEVVPLGAASGPPVGMLPTQRYRDESFTLEVGDIVVLMTDGIMEALHDENDEMGMAQLIALIGKGPRNLGEINTRIIEAVDERTRGAITDDITILSLEVTPRA